MASQQNKYCDLVMKGGITSGIVYPNAVLALAEEFRFKNIGGTSAGAIAAAISAAAAMGDRSKVNGQKVANEPDRVGFEGLAGIAGELSTQGFIYKLFQPVRGTRTAYRLIVILAGNRGAIFKWVTSLAAVIAIAPVEMLLILAVLIGVGFWAAGLSGVWAALLPSLICAYAGSALFAVLRVARVARKNLLGLCSGTSRPKRFVGRPSPALTEWLHEALQALSGKPLDEPLTFADLRNASRYEGEPKTQHAINLQMITTGVSHREPRTLPFNNATFWFLREEFELLFPEPVVRWMINNGRKTEQVAGKTYHRLPDGGDLPVLVGMRMSLSFPLLLSAVPLHEPAKRRPKNPAETLDAQTDTSAETNVAESTEGLATGGAASTSKITAFRVCWFSDGGISSNFPVHLFDATLPLWPTFAINLVYPKTDDRGDEPMDPIFLPTENNQGWQRTYQSMAHSVAVKEVTGFLFGIIATMQNWRDLLQSRAPGYRDRIVHVSLDASEGGMNLDMPQDVLNQISAKGTEAGKRLKTFSFDNHYWIRWRSLASAMQRYTMHVAQSDACAPKITAYAQAYDAPKQGVSPTGSYQFSSAAKREEAVKLLEYLIEKGLEWDDLGPDLTDRAPRPLPQLQISPIY